jgi:hypothetical protein
MSRSRHLEWKLQTGDFRVAATVGATDIAAYRFIFGPAPVRAGGDQWWLGLFSPGIGKSFATDKRVIGLEDLTVATNVVFARLHVPRRWVSIGEAAD